MTRRVVIVGNGMVGARLAEEIRRRDPTGSHVRITVFGAEPCPAYNRVLLSSVIAGGLATTSLRLYPPGWAGSRRVDLHIGTTVDSIDPRRRIVHTARGPEPYDDLVLATGSRAWIPPVAGLDHRTVATFRDLADCERIRALADTGSRFAVLGGGLLGCEAARGLANRGTPVTVVHPRSHLMERQLGVDAGGVLAAALRRHGVRVQLGITAEAWEPGVGLHCADGSLVPADALVVAAGVRAEIGLAEAAGVATDRGVLVDDRLATSVAHVFAIGDCAQHTGCVPGTVRPGWEQATVLADLLTEADTTARYRGSRTVVRLKARDIDLATVGDAAALNDPDNEILRFDDPTGGRHACIALHDDHVVGGTMIGLPDAAAAMIQFYDARAPAPSDRVGFLLGRALSGTAGGSADFARLTGSTVICRCNTVTKDALVHAWRSGATDVESLGRVTRAGRGCGGCVEQLRAVPTWAAGT